MQFAIFAMLIGFGTSALLGVPVISMLRRLKSGQPILQYVDKHRGKSGTPTMGGIIFVLGLIAGTFAMARGSNILAVITVCVTVAYAIIGFLDDFIKVRYKRNMGLKAYQKIISQLTVAVIVSVFAYLNDNVGAVLYVPFTSIEISLGWWIIPLNIFVFLACTNGVNLTDGLDGLAGGVTFVHTLFFGLIIYVISLRVIPLETQEELANLTVLCGALAGALLGYLLFNSHPASVFMGDTGSLALGGAVGSIAVMSRLTLLVPFTGIIFALSCISVIVQVLHYKRTKKRVFLMAPLHHHFELKGYKETKIAAWYTILTFVLGAAALSAVIIFF